MSRDGRERSPAGGAWASLALLGLGYLVLWGSLAGLPFQDIPNHLARAVIIGDLEFRGGERFGRFFEFDWSTLPYVLGDLLLLPLVEWLPVDVAGRVWIALQWLSLPLATWVLLRTWRVEGAALFAGLAFSLYLATDVFFLMGFANFRLGIALVLVAIAAWERALASDSPLPWGAWYGLAAAGYLMHLSALVFVIAAVGMLSALRLWERRAAFGRLLALGAPLLVLFAWHVFARELANDAPAEHADAVRKVLRVAAPLVRYGGRADLALFVAFVACAVGPLLAQARAQFDARDRELWLLAATFLGLYAVLPERQGMIWAIDVRALALAWLWLALAGARAIARLPARPVLAAAATAIVAGNLALLAARLLPDDRVMREYRALAADVPAGALVLPVLTQPKRGFTNPLAHASSYATIDGGAVVPYTFSGNEAMPMRYFRFRRRPDAPWQFWYQERARLPDGARVIERYDYLLVDLPVDWSRIPVDVEIVRANRVVALARVERRSADTGHRYYAKSAPR